MAHAGQPVDGTHGGQYARALSYLRRNDHVGLTENLEHRYGGGAQGGGMIGAVQHGPLAGGNTGGGRFEGAVGELLQLHAVVVIGGEEGGQKLLHVQRGAVALHEGDAARALAGLLVAQLGVGVRVQQAQTGQAIGVLRQ